MIKAKDPRLCKISVAYEGFIVPEGVPLPKYSQLTEALPVASLAEAAPSSPPVFQIEEEEEAEQEEEGSMDLASQQTIMKSSTSPLHRLTILRI